MNKFDMKCSVELQRKQCNMGFTFIGTQPIYYVCMCVCVLSFDLVQSRYVWNRVHHQSRARFRWNELNFIQLWWRFMANFIPHKHIIEMETVKG